MRCAVLADIHSNLSAFEAVLRDAEAKGGFTEIWCLGDVVGYGPDPRECLQLLRKHQHLCVAGNHDLAAAGKIDTSDFNPDAALANRWTAQQLTPEDKDYLLHLPDRLRQDDFTLVHGSPHHPIWEYLFSPRDALDNFAYFGTPYCLIGHSHVPLSFERIGENRCITTRLAHGDKVPLGKERLIVNPGGVGQPRDGDPRAAYAIYDSKERAICHYRVDYDIAATQDKMRRHGLPVRLITRLTEGW